MQDACFKDMCAIGGDATSQIADNYETALATSTNLASIAAGLYAFVPCVPTACKRRMAARLTRPRNEL
jgi:hypothetical protein